MTGIIQWKRLLLSVEKEQGARKNLYNIAQSEVQQLLRNKKVGGKRYKVFFSNIEITLSKQRTENNSNIVNNLPTNEIPKVNANK